MGQNIVNKIFSYLSSPKIVLRDKKYSKSNYNQLMLDLGSSDFPKLLEIKKQILDLNNPSKHTNHILTKVDLLISKKKSTWYNDHITPNLSTKEEKRILKDLILRILKDIQEAQDVYEYQKNKFGIAFDHTTGLKSILSTKDVRYNQLKIENSLPDFELPIIEEHTPIEWIKIVEDIIYKSEHPFDALLKIQIDLYNINEDPILISRFLGSKSEKGPKQEHFVHKKTEYNSLLINLAHKIPTIEGFKKHQENVQELKKGITVIRLAQLKRAIEFMVNNRIILMNTQNIDWFIYSLVGNIESEINKEFEANLCETSSKKANSDLKSIFAFLAIKGVIKFTVSRAKYIKNINQLITKNHDGLSATGWKNAFSELRKSNNIISFESIPFNHGNFIKFIENS